MFEKKLEERRGLSASTFQVETVWGQVELRCKKMHNHVQAMDTNVEKGYNSDVSVGGLSYHIQTEDWGRSNPFFVSRVFCNGAVVKSVKTSYASVLPQGPSADRQDILFALRCQHEQILDLLISGQLVSELSKLKG